MWGIGKKAPGFIISKNVTLDDTAFLTNRQWEDIVAESDRNNKEHVEHKIDTEIQSSSGDEREDIASEQ